MASHSAARGPARAAVLRLPYGWGPLLFVVGVLLRLSAVLLAPRYGYSPDHDDFVRWGILAADQGLTALYTAPAPLHPQVRYHGDGRTSLRTRRTRRVLNYPPASAYVFWAAGHAHAWIDARRYVNTPLSRLLYAAPSMLADLLVALACLKIVLLLLARSERGAEPAAARAPPSGWSALYHPFVLCWLAPPILVDSSLWGQNDAWVMAALAWMLWAMLRANWLPAGVFYGIALACKPLAIFALPVWAYAALFRSGRVRIVAGLVVAVGLLNVLALPFWWTSGARWFQESYLGHVVRSGEATTLSAFNIWYVDALLRESRDAASPLWGLPRSLWGGVLLGAAGLVIVITHRLLLRRCPLELVAVAASMLLAVAMFPTGMHERYVLLSFPFLIAVAAAARRGAWAALMVWMVAGTLQMTWCNWAGTLAGKEYAELRAEYEGQRQGAAETGDPADREQRLRSMEARRARDRPVEWATTILALLATLVYYGSLPSAALALTPGRPAAARSSSISPVDPLGVE